MNDRAARSNAYEQKLWRLFDAIDRHELETFREIFAENIYYERPRFPPLVGIEALIKFYRDERPIAEGQHLTDQVIANATCGAAWGRLRGVTRSGGAVDLIWSDVYEFDASGLVHKRRSYVFDAGEKL